MIVTLDAYHGREPARYWSVTGGGDLFPPRVILCRTRQEAREIRAEMQSRAVNQRFAVVRVRVWVVLEESEE